MKDIKLEKEIIDFFNKVKDADDIRDKIRVDPKFKKRGLWGIGGGIKASDAKRIIEFRKSLPNKKFQYIEQIENINKTSAHLFHNILYTFKGTSRSERWNNIIDWFKKNKTTLELDRFQRIEQDYIEGSIEIDYQKIPLTIYTVQNSDHWELRMNIERETSISSLNDLLKAFGGAPLKKVIPLSVRRINRIKILEFKAEFSPEDEKFVRVSMMAQTEKSWKLLPQRLGVYNSVIELSIKTGDEVSPGKMSALIEGFLRAGKITVPVIIRKKESEDKWTLTQKKEKAVALDSFLNLERFWGRLSLSELFPKKIVKLKEFMLLNMSMEFSGDLKNISFCRASTGSSQPLNLGKKGLILDQLSISLEVETLPDFKRVVNKELKGGFKVKGGVIPVVFHMPEGEKNWLLKTESKQDFYEVSRADLPSLLNDYRIEDFLPKFADIEGLSVKEYIASFSVDREIPNKISIVFGNMKFWEIIPDQLSLNYVEFQLIINNPYNLQSAGVNGVITGDILIGSSDYAKVPVMIEFDRDSNKWKLTKTTKEMIALPDEGRLLGLPGREEFMEILPDTIDPITDLALSDLEVILSGGLKKMDLVSQSFRSVKNWKVVEGWHRLGELVVQVDISGFEDVELSTRGDIKGFVKVKNTEFYFISPLPIAESGLTLYLREPMKDPATPDLADLIAEETLENVIPGIDGFSDMELSALAIEFDPEYKTINDISINILNNSRWHILEKDLILENSEINLTFTQPLTPEKKIEGEIIGDLSSVDSKEVVIPVKIGLSGDDPEWRLELAEEKEAWTPGLEDIRNLIQGKDFVDFLPSSFVRLNDFSISELKINFDVNKKIFSSLSLFATTEDTWEILGDNWTSMEEISVKLDMGDISVPEYSYQGEIEGKLSAEDTKIPVKISLPSEGGELAIELSEETKANKAADISSLSGDFKLEDFFPNLEAFRDFPLSELKIKFNDKLDDIKLINFLISFQDKWFVISEKLFIDNPTIYLEISDPLSVDQAKVGGKVVGVVKGNQEELDIPVEVEVSNESDSWPLSSTSQSSTASLSLISGLTGGEDLLSILPPSAADSRDLNMVSMEIVFSPGFADIFNMDLKFELENKWVLVPGALTFKQTEINLYISVPLSPLKIPGSLIKGEIIFEDGPVAMPGNFSVPDSGSDQLLKLTSGDEKIFVRHIKDLSLLPGIKQFLGLDPYGSLKNAKSHISSLEMNIQPMSGYISQINYTLEPEDEWTLIPGRLSFDKLEADLEIRDPLADNFDFKESVKGVIKADSLDIPVCFERSESGSGLNLRLISPVEADKSASLYYLTQSFKFKDFFDNWNDDSALKLSKLDIKVSSDYKNIDRVFMEAVLKEDLGIAQDGFILESPILELYMFSELEVEEKNKGRLRGYLTGGEKGKIRIPIELPVTSKRDLWNLSLDKEGFDVFMSSLFDMEGLAGSGYLTDGLPEALSNIPNYHLSELDAEVSSGLSKVGKVFYHLENNTAWKIVPDWLPLSDPDIKLVLDNSSERPEVAEGKIEGRVLVGDSIFPLEATFPYSSSGLVLRTPAPISISDLNDLSKWMANFDLGSFLPNLSSVDDLYLGELELYPDERFQYIERINLSLIADGSWPVIPEWLSLADATVNIEITFSEDSRKEAKGSISGNMRLGENEAPSPATVDILPDDRGWVFSSGPDFNISMEKLAKLRLANGAFLDILPGGMGYIKGLILSDLKINFAPLERKISLLSFGVSSAQAWDIIPDWFPLRRLEGRIEIEEPMTAAMSVDGQFSGVVKLGSTDFPFNGSLPLSSSGLSLRLSEKTAVYEAEDLSWLFNIFNIESVLPPLSRFSDMEASVMELKVDSSFSSIYSLSLDAGLSSPFNLSGDRLAFDNASIVLKTTRLSDFSEDISASIRGEVLAGDQANGKLPALITLDKEENLWILETETDNPAQLERSVFFQRLGLSSAESLFSPATLNENISLKKLRMKFTPGFESLSKVELSFQVGANWKINDDLPAVKNIEVELEVEDPLSDNPKVQEQIHGSIRLGDYKALVTIVPESPSSAKLTLREKLTFVKAGELSSFSKLFKLENLPRAASGFPGVSLSAMDMDFDFSANLIERLSLRLDADGKYWKRIGEIFRVYGDEIQIEAVYPLEKESGVFLDIKGRTPFKGRDIPVIVSPASGKNAYQLKLAPEANFRFDGVASLADLLKEKRLLTKLPRSLTTSGEIGLSDLRASIDDKGKVSGFSLEFSLLNSWTAVKNWTPLNRTEVQIVVDKRESPGKTFVGSIRGVINAGDTMLKLKADLSGAKKEYSLNLTEAAEVGKISDLDMLVDDLRIGQYLYNSGENSEKTLENFAARFNPKLQTLSEISLSLKTDGEWVNFSEGSTFGSGCLYLEIFRPLDKKRRVVPAIRGKLLNKEESWEIPVRLDIEKENETWLMRLDSQNTVFIPALSGFSRAMGLDIGRFLPRGFNKVKGLELNSFSGRLSLERDKLLETAFEFSSPDGWRALSESYLLRRVGFSCNINDLLNAEPRCEGQITGVLDKGEVSFPVRMSISSRDSGYQLELVERLSFSDSSALFHFINEADLGKFASYARSLSDVSFADFKVIFDPGLKEVKQIFLKMEVGAPWSVIPERPPMSDSVLSVETTYFSAGQPELDIRLNGKMNLASGVDILVDGYFDVSKDMWSLQMSGEEVEIGSWSTLETLSVAGKISGSLPKDLRSRQKPVLSALTINASPSLSTADSLGFEVKLNRPWPVLPKWDNPKWRSISEMTVQGHIAEPFKQDSAIKGAIAGVIKAGRQRLPVRLLLPAGEKGWFLLSADNPALSGDIIFGLLLERFKLAKYLPGVSDIKKFQLNNFEVEFDRNFEFMPRLTIDLSFEETWPLIPERILMKEGRLFLEIESLDGANINITGFLQGKLLGGENSSLEIPATLDISSFDEDWALRLNSLNTVYISRRNDLDYIVGKPNILDCLPGDLAEVDDFILDDFLAYTTPASRKITSIEFSLKAVRLWKIAPGWHPIHDININLSIDAQSSKDRGKGELKGNLRAGTLDIPVSTPLPSSDLEIYFDRALELSSNPQMAVLFKDLYQKEFLSLISKNSLISQTEILFNPDINNIGKVCSVVNSEECSFIPQKLVVKEAEIKIEAENPYGKEKLLKAVVKGKMALGEISDGDIPVTATTSDIQGEWILTLLPGKSFILTNLKAWLLWLEISGPEYYLPEGALEIPGVELNSMEIKFSAVEKKFVSASCGLRAVHNWKVSSDWPELNDLNIELFINYSGDDNERLLGEVRGALRLGSSSLPIIFDLPCVNSTPVFRLADNVKLSTDDLSLLREKLDWEKYLPGFFRFRELSLSDLNIEFTDQLKAIRKIHLNADADDSWNMLSERLSIKDLNIELGIEYEETSVNPVSGAVKGVSVFRKDDQSLEIPIIVDMSERPSKWSLKLGATENIDLAGWNIIDFLKASGLVNESQFADGFLDAELKEILGLEDLELSGLEIESVGERADYIYLVLQKSREWSLIPKRLTLYDLKIRLELNKLSGDSPELNASLSGFVKNEKFEFPVYSRLSSETPGFKLELAEKTKLSRAADLYLLFDDDKIQSAPNLDDLRDVYMESFDLWVSSADPHIVINKLYFAVADFKNWDIIHQTLSFREGRLSLSLAYSSSEDNYGVQGEIDGYWLPRADSRLIPIMATIPENDRRWTLKLKPGFHALQSEMSDLVRAATGSPLFSLLPAELDSISGLVLNSLQARFYPEERITSASFNLKTAYIWECVPGLLPLGELNIRFDITEPMSADRELDGTVQGALFLGGTRIPINFALSYSDWRLELTEETALAHISDFDVILGDFDLREFFPEIEQLSNISLSEFNLRINPFSKAISRLSFKLNTDNFYWSVGRNNLRRVVINLEIKQPLEEDREIRGVVQGILSLDEKEESYIPIEVDVTNEETEEWTFSLSPIASDSLYTLSELEELFMDGEVFGATPPRFKESRDFKIFELNGLYSRKLNKIESFSIKLGGDNIWRIVPDWFSFADVEIEAEAKSSNEGELEISGAISGKIQAGDSVFSLYYPLSSSPSEFSLELKEKVALGKLDELSRFLGNFELETFLPNIETSPELIINEINIRFSDDFSRVETQFINLETPEEFVWTLISDHLILSEASIDLVLRDPFASQRESVVEIRGMMRMDEAGAVKIPVIIGKPYETDDYYLRLADKKEVPQLGVADLKILAESNFLNILPDDLRRMPQIRLLELNMIFGSRLSQLSTAVFKAELMSDWKPLSGWRPIKRAVLYFGIIESDAPTVTVDIEGFVETDGSDLKVGARFSANSSELQLNLKENARLAKADDLSLLLGNFKWEEYFPGFSRVRGLDLLSLEFKIRPELDAIESCSMRLSSGDYWRLIDERFPLGDFSADLEITAPLSVDKNIKSRVEGNLIFGALEQLKIPVILTLPSLDSDWAVQLKGEENIILSKLEYIEELLGNIERGSCLPVGADSTEGMTLTDFRMTLPLRAEKTALINVRLQSVEIWEIISDWARVGNFVINLNVQNPVAGQFSTEGDIQAAIQLGDVLIPVNGSLPFFGFDLRPEKELLVSSLRDLSRLLPGFSLEELFPGLAQAENLTLSGLRTRFNERLTGLDQIRLNLKYSQGWDIIPEGLTVYDGQLELEASYPQDSEKTFVAKIHGNIQGSPDLPPNIPVRIDINEGETSWKLQLNNNSDLILILPGLKNLSVFFGAEELFMSLPDEFLEIDGFSLSALEAEIYPHLKEISKLSFVMKTVYSFEPVSGWSTINNIEMSFYIDKPLFFNTSRRAEVRGLIKNNNLELPLKASLFKSDLVFELSEVVALESLADLSVLLRNFDFSRHIPGYEEISSYLLNKAEIEWDLKFEEIKRVSLQLSIPEHCSLAAEQLILKDAIVDLDIDYPLASYRDVKGTLRGLAQTAGSNSLSAPAVIEINSRLPRWKMEFVDIDKVGALNWQELKSLPGGKKWGAALYPGLTELRGLKLESGNMVFNAGFESLYKSDFVITIQNDWPVAENLSLSGLNISSEIIEPLGDSEISGEIKGRLKLADMEAPLASAFPKPSLKFVLDTQFYLSIYNLADICKVGLEVDLDKYLPGLSQVNNLHLSGLEIEFHPGTKVISALRFQIQARERWSIAHNLSLDDSKVNFAVFQSKEYVKKIEAQIKGIIPEEYVQEIHSNIDGIVPKEKFIGNAFPVVIAIDNDNQWNVSLDSEFTLKLLRFKSLGQLPGSETWLGCAPDALNRIKEWQLFGFSFDFLPATKEFSGFKLLLASQACWHVLADSYLKVKKLKLELEAKNFKDGQKTITGKIQGVIPINKISIPISVSLPLKDDELRFDLTRETSLYNISDLSFVSDKMDLKELLADLPKSHSVILEELSIVCDKRLSKPDKCDLRIKLKENPKIADNFKLEDVVVKIAADFSGKNPDVQADIAAVLTTENNTIPVQIETSPGREEWHIKLRPQTRPVKAVLNKLPNHKTLFNLGPRLPENFCDLKGLIVSDFILIYLPAEETLSASSFKLETFDCWDIIPDWFTLSNLSLQARATNPASSKAIVEGEVSGAIQVGGTNIGVKIPLPFRMEDLDLSLVKAESFSKVSDFNILAEKFYSPNDWIGYNNIPGLLLTILNVKFDLILNRVAKLSFGLSVNDSWEIIKDKLSIRETSIELAIEQYPAGGITLRKENIEGLLATETKKTGMPVSINRDENHWILTGTSSEDFPLDISGAQPALSSGEGLSDVLSATNIKEHDWRIKTLEFRFPLNRQDMEEISCLLTSSEKWRILPGRFVENLHIHYKLTYSLKAPSVSSKISGLMSVGKLGLPVFIFSPAGKNLTIQLDAEDAALSGDDIKNLSSLLDNFDITEALPGIETTADLKLYQISLEANPRSGDFSQVLFKLRSDKKWRIIPDRFSLSKVDICLESYMAADFQEKMKGSAKGVLILGKNKNIELPIELILSPEDSQWKLSLAEDRRALFNDTSELFGIIENQDLLSDLPESFNSVGNLEARGLEVAFSGNLEEIKSVSLDLKTVQAWEFIRGWHPLCGISAQVQSSLPMRKPTPTTGRVRGNLKISSSATPAEVSSSSSDGLYNLRLLEKIPVDRWQDVCLWFGFNEILRAFDDSKKIQAYPPLTLSLLNALKDLSLSSLFIEFDGNRNPGQKAGITIESASKLKLLNNFPQIDKVNLRFDVQDPLKLNSVISGKIDGLIVIEEEPLLGIPVDLNIGEPGVIRDLELISTQAVEIRKLSRLNILAGFDLFDYLPITLDGLGSVDLSDVKLIFGSDKAGKLSFNVRFDKKWTLIPNEISLGGLQLQMEVELKNGVEVKVNVVGLIRMDNEFFEITGVISSIGNDWLLHVWKEDDPDVKFFIIINQETGLVENVIK